MVEETEKSPPAAGACRVTATPPLFAAVKVTVGEVVPTTTEPKFRLPGESARFPGVAPCPVSEAVAGLLLKPPAILSRPLRLPRAEGENVTTTVQLLPEESDAVQLVEATAKSPLAVGAWRLTGAPPLLVAVKVVDADVEPRATVPKL